MLSVSVNLSHARPSRSQSALNGVQILATLLVRSATIYLCIKLYNAAKHVALAFDPPENDGSNETRSHQVNPQISIDHIRHTSSITRSSAPTPSLHLCISIEVSRMSDRKASFKVFLSVLLRADRVECQSLGCAL